MRELVGIDEAGRGPLAGPVSVGVVRASEGFDFFVAFPALNDSKQLSEKKREEIYEKVREFPEIIWTVEMNDASYIDAQGIVPAVFDALERGLQKVAPDVGAVKVWLDGALRAPREYDQETVIGGDGKIPAIMLASVLAKVTRDRLMVELALKYPEYGFEKHKGYGTKMHQEAMLAHGLSELHRKSFCKKLTGV